MRTVRVEQSVGGGEKRNPVRAEGYVEITAPVAERLSLNASDCCFIKRKRNRLSNAERNRGANAPAAFESSRDAANLATRARSASRTGYTVVAILPRARTFRPETHRKVRAVQLKQ